MGFYSSSRLYQESSSNVPEITLEQVMQDPNIQPTEQEDLIEASLNIIGNIQENQNRFFQHIGMAELDYMEANGQEMIYTEGVLGDIVSTIKSFLMKIWERIKSLFKRFIMILDSYSKNDKDFAKKYQKQIFSKSGDTSDFTFKGYKWNIDTNVVSAMCSATGVSSKEVRQNIESGDYKADSTEKVQKTLENLNDIIEKLRGVFAQKFKITSGAGSLTEEEFRKELHEYFRGGESEKEELDSKDIDVHDMYNHLITSNQDRKDVDRVFKENKKAIDQDEKELTRIQNDYAKNAHTYDDTEVNDPSKTVAVGTNIDGKAIVRDYKAKFNNTSTVDINGTAVPIDASNPQHINTMLSALGKTRNDYSVNVNSTGKTTKKDMGNRKSKALNIAMRLVSATKSLLICIDSEFLNAMKERSRQYKACLIAYVHHRSSNESAMEEQVYNEAAYTRFSSPLKSINLF